MTTVQEIVDLADAMQLLGEERKAFIAGEMDKLRNLQVEEREKEKPGYKLKRGSVLPCSSSFCKFNFDV